MTNGNEYTLESIISAYVNSCYNETPPTEEEFNNAAELMRNANSFLTVTDEEFEGIKKRLRGTVAVTLDNGICLPDPKNGHQSWLPARRADIDFYYWDRYKKYLEEVKHWNPRVTSKLGQVAEEILDQCGDPKGKDFRIRGLVLGDVQSGKTSNYTALANKAADVGYELIIVLAGIPEILRQQTQIRLDKEFCGRQSNLYLDPKSTIKYSPVGVGKYGNKKQIASFTSEAKDFDEGVLKSNNLALANVNCPILLVVKKNKTILNNLYSWLRNNNPINGNGQIEKSLLLIDDEADNASVNTKKDPDSDPTAINGAIRDISTFFSKSTYLAVTATPFANIFIDPNLPEDLFPADFIYALDAPSNYIGADRIFSQDGDKRDYLETINTSDFETYFPEKHKKELEVKDLPNDLYEAMEYFLLANAIRDYSGDYTEHRSMLIHVSRFVNVQNQIAEVVYAWLDQVKSDIRNYHKLQPSKAQEIASIQSLHQTWNKYGLQEKFKITWEEILSEYLYRAIAPIDVRAVNGKKGSILDYDKHKDDGLRVIAVGGNVLSRGLTLEGLMVSYFHRNTNMYDTLMQMGRWFGYRDNYDNLVKIWLSSDAIDWYGQIQDATQDLRDQIEEMKQAKLSPRQFGLKVKQDPGSLIVTARNKMRTAHQINCPIKVSGHLLETPRLIASNEVLNQNAHIIENFIDRLSIDGERVPESEEITKQNYFWSNVDGSMVSNLLLEFKTHPWHMSYNGRALAAYVSKMPKETKWDVVLINRGTGDAYFKKLKCGNEELTIEHTEKRAISVSKNMLSVSGSNLRVGSGGCASIGLTNEQIRIAREDYLDNYTGNRLRPNVPDSAYLIEGRNPILMIHIIQAVYDDSCDYPPFLYGIGVGFPKDNVGNATAIYQVNLIELANWLEPDEDDDED